MTVDASAAPLHCHAGGYRDGRTCASRMCSISRKGTPPNIAIRAATADTTPGHADRSAQRTLAPGLDPVGREVDHRSLLLRRLQNGGCEQSVNNLLPNSRLSAGFRPSYRHEEPTSPNACMNLLTGGLLVRVQPEEPTASKSATCTDELTAVSIRLRVSPVWPSNCHIFSNLQTPRASNAHFVNNPRAVSTHQIARSTGTIRGRTSWASI